eukprot:6185998-Pleurochrysis_carterae.AAC.1
MHAIAQSKVVAPSSLCSWRQRSIALHRSRCNHDVNSSACEAPVSPIRGSSLHENSATAVRHSNQRGKLPAHEHLNESLHLKKPAPKRDNLPPTSNYPIPNSDASVRAIPLRLPREQQLSTSDEIVASETALASSGQAQQ